MTEPPRTTYNKAICQRWYNDNGIVPGVPPVSCQVELMPLDPRGLHPYGYNPSIWPVLQSNGQPSGKHLLAYRYHPDLTQPETQIAIAELDRHWRVTANHNIKLEGESNEDPRFFWHDSKLWLSWVKAKFARLGGFVTSMSCCVAWSNVNTDKWSVGFECDSSMIPGADKLQKMEKNWVPFEHKKTLKTWYSPSRILNGAELPPPKWLYGPMKGGTNPVPYLGAWLRFVHSTLDNEAAPFRRRYFVGCILYDKDTLEIIGHSKEPIITGSEADNLTETARAACPRWKPKVVFPAGCIQVDGGWLISLGVNDAACAIAKITPSMLKL